MISFLFPKWPLPGGLLIFLPSMHAKIWQGMECFPKEYLILLILCKPKIWLIKIWSNDHMGFILKWILLIMVLICMVLDINTNLKHSYVLVLPRSAAQHFVVIHTRLSKWIGTTIFTHTLFLTPILLHFHNPLNQVRFNISNSWKVNRFDPAPPPQINN